MSQVPSSQWDCFASAPVIAPEIAIGKNRTLRIVGGREQVNTRYHNGKVAGLACNFEQVWQMLHLSDARELKTERGNPFEVTAGVSATGEGDERVIRIRGKGATHAYIYGCCWGRAANHYGGGNGNRIGSYCRALDLWSRNLES